MIASAPSPPETIEGYVFGPFRLDIRRRILYSGSSPTPIPERLFQMLLILIQGGGKAISREVLARDVWGDTGVTDTNLNQHVYLLRLLLHEHKSERKYVVTVPREGYRFAVAASPLTTHTRSEDSFAEEEMELAERSLEAGGEAFQLYCRGSYLLNRQTVACLGAAIEAFGAVLAADPDYVPGLLGLARANVALAQSAHAPPRPCFQRAQASVERVLRIDPRSSAAHAVLSELSLFADWNWPRAGRSAQTSLALNPQSVIARSSAAWYYVCRGDTSRALHEAAQALLVEPASLWLQLLQARILLHGGDYAKAIAAMGSVLLADPDYGAARRYRAQALVLNRQFDDAIEDLIAPADRDDWSGRLALLGRAHAGLGNLRRAQKIYGELFERRKYAYVSSWDLAILCEVSGSSDDTLRHLQAAFAEREPAMLFLKTLPWFASLVRRSEFKRLIRRTQASIGQPST